MRDIIWTVILIWLVYKIASIFRLNTSRTAPGGSSHTEQTSRNTASHSAVRNDEEIKKAVKNHLNKEGEYVDFEELK